MKRLPDRLQGIVEGSVIILGVGNRLRGDDSAGPLLVDKLSGLSGIRCIDGGAAPENYLEQVVSASPDTVLVVDAVEFGGKPGEVRALDPEELSQNGLSTHTLSLRVVSDYLRARGNARILIVGIQPQSCEIGTEMSPQVSEAVEELGQKLRKILAPGAPNRKV